MLNTKELMHCHCGTNNRAPRWTFMDPCKPEVRPGARVESASPAWLAAPAMNACDTTKVYNNTNFKRHFLESGWSYRCKNVFMPIKKIKPNDIFQNCVHSSSTLRLFISLHDNRCLCPITSLFHISLQSCCILLKIRQNRRFWSNRVLLVLI